MECGIPSREMLIAFNGRPLLEDKKTLKELGISEGDVLIIQHMQNSNSNLLSGSCKYYKIITINKVINLWKIVDHLSFKLIFIAHIRKFNYYFRLYIYTENY